MLVRFPNFSAPVERWAAELVRALDNVHARIERLYQPRNAPIDLFPVEVGSLPEPKRDGLVVLVKDAAGGAVPAYSRDGAWLRFDTNAPVA